MHLSDSELFRCLQSFSKQEQQEFTIWLKSVSGSKQILAAKLWDVLIDNKKHWKAEDFDLKHCHQLLFPNSTFKAQRLRDSMSLLYALAKDYLISKELKEEPEVSNRLLLQQFRKRGLDKAHQVHLNRWQKSLTESSRRDNWWFYQQHLAVEAAEALVEERNVRRPKDLLQESINSLDVYYISRKVQALCEMQNRSMIFRQDYEQHLRTEIQSALTNENYLHLNEACISVYYRILKTFDEPDETDHFHRLLEEIAENAHSFTPEEARNLYRYAENYCIRKINKSLPNWLEQLFIIYEQLIRTKLILQKGQFPHTDFKNIVTVGLRLGKNNWVYQFIQENHLSLDESIRTNAYNYNLANYFYETKEFDSVVELLREVEFTDLFYEISSKYILIKVYYELNEHFLLSYLITSLGRFISRNKEMSNTNKQAIQNFLALSKKLNRYQQDCSTRKLEQNRQWIRKIELEIEKGKPTTNLPWIKTQLAQINESF